MQRGSAENGGAAGNLRGGFVMRVRRVDTAGTQLSVDRELTVSYVMNTMAPALMGDLRGALLVFAAYQSLNA